MQPNGISHDAGSKKRAMTTKRVADIKATLCLPHTPFPMRANLSALEQRLLAHWQSIDLYTTLLDKRVDGKSFVLHDGPPYASGELQWSHILNKILKDIILRYRSMLGQRCEFVPGWDCHSLTVEQEVEQRHNEDDTPIEKGALRRECRELAHHYLTTQREQFQRLGILGDWDHAYSTMSPSYQAAITRALANLMRSESLVQRTRPVFWCTECETALAEFEVFFQPREMLEAYLTYPLISDPMHLDRQLRGRDVEFLAWTSDVWTLPGVMAMAVEPDAEYVAVRSQRKVYVLAKERLEDVAQACGWEHVPEVLVSFQGRQFASLSCRHPLIHRKLPFCLIPSLRLAPGTGVLQLSPGHDPLNYEAAQQHDLELLSPVDEKGRFTHQAGPWAGKSVWESEPRILRDLEAVDSLLSSPEATVVLKYPYSLRSGEPIIFRATTQWFVPMNVKELRQRAQSSLEQMEWQPDWGYKRMNSLLQRRSDWCMSRQRVWGVPLPIFYCTRCKTPLLDPDHVDILAERYEQNEFGADLWFDAPVEELLPYEEGGLRCERCGNHQFRQEEDIVDVWFDSGVSAWAVLPHHQEDKPLSTMAVEGVDQFRGWFQGALLTTLQLSEKLPFQAIVAHGRVGGESSAMTTAREQHQALISLRQRNASSEEKAQTLTPQQAMERWGAEILRLWVVADDFHVHRVFEAKACQRLTRTYRKVRNCFRFLLGNLYDFSPSEPVDVELMDEVDRYAIHLVHHRVKAIRQHYKAYEFHLAWRQLVDCCIRDLSSFYFEVIKDRLYNSAPDWYVRRSAQSALFRIADVLCRVAAPLLSFTSEDVWQHLHASEEADSVHWSLLPEPSELPVMADDQAAIWDGLRVSRKKVLRAFANTSDSLRLKRPWEAAVRLYPNTTLLREALELCDEETLPFILGVSQAEVAPSDEPTPREAWRSSLGSLAVEVKRADGRRCRRCRYMYAELQDAGSHPTCSRCQRAMEHHENAGESATSSEPSTPSS
ncbi:MAG: isoleucine--tRNA ligase [Deltaproteobacteria bacterium]|nr:MAG: isoleucine--tRNA ligase [Deltaproteobacteria bacterium]